jgi:hypothetical protein
VIDRWWTFIATAEDRIKKEIRKMYGSWIIPGDSLGVTQKRNIDEK